MNPRILVIDGNMKAINDANVAAGGFANGEAYAAVLQSIRPEIECYVLSAADPGGDQLPQGTSIQDFDGAAITGSALNMYDGGPAIDQQIALARAAFEAEVPVFGSCWGLQLMAAALGGSVRANPKGRELFVARNIWRTEAGKDHPLFGSKPQAFDAPAVHTDEVETIPAGATVLASNAMSDVQAMAVIRGKCHFWGVQYHPEFSTHDLAVILRRYGQRLVDEGLFASMDALNAYAASASAMYENPENTALQFEMGLTPAVLDAHTRLTELRSWLDHVVIGQQRGH